MRHLLFKGFVSSLAASRDAEDDNLTNLVKDGVDDPPPTNADAEKIVLRAPSVRCGEAEVDKAPRRSIVGGFGTLNTKQPV